MAMPNDLVMVRHGYSEANEIQKRIKQQADYEIPAVFHDRHDSLMVLADLGIEQASAAGEWLNSEFPEGFDNFYVSPHNRTLKTAGLLALGGAWKLDDRWRERDWGEYGILNDDERLEKYELSHKLQGQNKWYWCPPGGESLATGVRLRFEDTLDTLHREATGQRVVAVTHGETIDVARFVLERMTPQEWLLQDKDSAYKISNCQIMHYSRINPHDGSVSHKLEWRRSICPWDESRSWQSGEWVNISHTRYSDEELIAMADSVEPLLGD